MEEILDIVDMNGEPTGETTERGEAHLRGIPHRTAHVWIFRERDGRIQILLQKRASHKSSFPGCYDISSAGHIPAGIDYIPSALRELKEELGISAPADELHYCGQRYICQDDIFFGREFHDRQISRIYTLRRDIEISGLVLQKEEVDDAMWIYLDECIEAVRNGSFKNCIDIEELIMLKKHLESSDILS